MFYEISEQSIYIIVFIETSWTYSSRVHQAEFNTIIFNVGTPFILYWFEKNTKNFMFDGTSSVTACSLILFDKY